MSGQIRMSSIRRLAASIWLVALGCGEEPTVALDLELVQDPNINTPEQVRERIDEVVMIVDSSGGLYEPGREEVRGDLEIADIDSDPALELTARIALVGDRLPTIRLERGGLPDVSLDLTVIGRSTSGEQQAEGSVRGARFGEGISPLSLPFNIRPERLPPRVTEVIPGDGEEVRFCDVEVLVVIFSRPMDLESLTAEGNVEIEPGGAPVEIRLDPSGQIAHLLLRQPFRGEDTFTYRLTISDEVLGRDGQPLDMVAAEEGGQRYDVEHTLVCVQRVTGPPDPCGDALAPPCPQIDRLECVDDVCRPVTCEGSRCPEAHVCVPALGLCELDCRLYGDGGACPAERPWCDLETGGCGER